MALQIYEISDVSQKLIGLLRQLDPNSGKWFIEIRNTALEHAVYLQKELENPMELVYQFTANDQVYRIQIVRTAGPI